MQNSNDLLFSSLDNLSEPTLRGIMDMGFEEMTAVQARTIPYLLGGNDAVVTANAGSGKTLAFLIPAVELMHNLEFCAKNRTGIIIISPTQLLSMQTFDVLKQLSKHHSHTYGIIMGGANHKVEAETLRAGVNIVIATPKGLLAHLQVSDIQELENNVIKAANESEIADSLHECDWKSKCKSLSSQMTDVKNDCKRINVLFHKESSERKKLEKGNRILQEEIQNLKCQISDQVDSSRFFVNTSIKNGVIMFSCSSNSCGYSSLELRLVRQHMIICKFTSLNFVLKCPHCEQWFDESPMLLAHFNTHTNE